MFKNQMAGRSYCDPRGRRRACAGTETHVTCPTFRVCAEAARPCALPPADHGGSVERGRWKPQTRARRVKTNHARFPPSAPGTCLAGRPPEAGHDAQGCTGRAPRGLAVRRPGAVSMRFSFQVPHRCPTGWCLTEKQSRNKPSLWKSGLGTVNVQPMWRVEPGGGHSGWARGHGEAG